MSDKLPSSAEQVPAPHPDDRASLSERARGMTARWREALAQQPHLPPGADDTTLTRAVAQAGRAMVARVGLAMLQEGLLQAEDDGAGTARVVFPTAGGADAVLVQGLPQGSASLFPELCFFRRGSDGGLVPIKNPAALLQTVAPALPDTPRGDLLRMLDELTDAQLNEALCNAWREAWSARLRAAAGGSGATTFWGWLKRETNRSKLVVLLEQWSATGHPYHPTHKTRRGMAPAEVLVFCPEFRPQVRVALFAARRERVCGEALPDLPPFACWLEHAFPAQAEAWRAALSAKARDPEDYVALPVHPWQARHAVPERFARALAKGDLLALPGLAIPADPLVSVRTLAAATGAEAPHLKLSLGVRLTSVERTISPRSCIMGPRISHLLERLIARDDVLARTLRILPEEVGLHFASDDPQEAADARYLAALLRGNPSRLCGAGDFVVPATALAVASPVTGAPLFLELGQAGAVDDSARARALFARYAEAYLRPLLTLYLRYGIGLEAHLQNSLVLCDASGDLRSLVFRDFGGIRIHEATLTAAGLDLALHSDRLTLADTRGAVRGKLTAHGLHRHLGFLISRICQYLGSDEGPFWADVAGIGRTVFDELRGDVGAATWREERQALLDDDWEFKANLRMRLANLSKDVYVRIANPLRRDC